MKLSNLIAGLMLLLLPAVAHSQTTIEDISSTITSLTSPDWLVLDRPGDSNTHKISVGNFATSLATIGSFQTGTDQTTPSSGQLGIIDTEAEFESELFAIVVPSEFTTHTSDANAHHAPTVDTNLTQEEVEDFISGMLTGTQSGITVAYDDPNGELDFTVTGGGGGGEVNTASNLGGGLANFSVKSGDDLRFNSFAAGDFNLASNVISIDTATWLAEAELDTMAELQAQVADATVLDTTQLDTEAEFESALFGIVVSAELTSHAADANAHHTPTVDTNLSAEEVEDFIGGMLGGTQSGITVSYDDPNGELDFTVTGGSGEVNTASNLGGGLASFDSKSSLDLRFNSFAAADFNLASNVISIDTATWLAEAELDTMAELQSQIADQTVLDVSQLDTEAEFEAALFAVVTPGEVASTLEKNFSFYHSTDLTTYDGVAKIQWANAVTVTEIACSTDAGTVTINLEERAETTPNTAGTDAMSSDLVCDTDQQATTSFANDTFDADDWATVTISAAATATIVNITVKYTLQ